MAASTQLPLGTLIDLAQNRTDDATRRLGELQSVQLSAAEKLKLLRDYREDYLAQFNVRMRGGLPLSQLRNYQAFVSTLDGAIEQQAAIAAQAEQRLDKGRRPSSAWTRGAATGVNASKSSVPTTPWPAARRKSASAWKASANNKPATSARRGSFNIA